MKSLLNADPPLGCLSRLFLCLHVRGGSRPSSQKSIGSCFIGSRVEGDFPRILYRHIPQVCGPSPGRGRAVSPSSAHAGKITRLEEGVQFQPSRLVPSISPALGTGPAKGQSRAYPRAPLDSRTAPTREIITCVPARSNAGRSSSALMDGRKEEKLVVEVVMALKGGLNLLESEWGRMSLSILAWLFMQVLDQTSLSLLSPSHTRNQQKECAAAHTNRAGTHDGCQRTSTSAPCEDLRSGPE